MENLPSGRKASLKAFMTIMKVPDNIYEVDEII